MPDILDESSELMPDVINIQVGTNFFELFKFFKCKCAAASTEEFFSNKSYFFCSQVDSSLIVCDATILTQSAQYFLGTFLVEHSLHMTNVNMSLVRYANIAYVYDPLARITKAQSCFWRDATARWATQVEWKVCTSEGERRVSPRL